MAKRKQATKTPAPSAEPDLDTDGNRSDRRLIEHCIVAGSSLAAIEAAYEHDPDGDFKRAEKFSEQLQRSRDKALEAMAGMSAATVHGLKAKARLVATLADNHKRGGLPLEDYAELVRIFADDVYRMMRALDEAPGAVIGLKR
jgi:hypothetical protein